MIQVFAEYTKQKHVCALLCQTNQALPMLAQQLGTFSKVPAPGITSPLSLPVSQIL